MLKLMTARLYIAEFGCGTNRLSNSALEKSSRGRCQAGRCREWRFFPCPRLCRQGQVTAQSVRLMLRLSWQPCEGSSAG
jgi:hypothetical protein